MFKYLIITSSGGGGHITAAEGIIKELTERVHHPVLKEEIKVIYLMGERSIVGEIDCKQNKVWIPTIEGFITNKIYFSGKANTRIWDETQKQGGIESVRSLERLGDWQSIAEYIQYNSIYKNMKQFLEENPNIKGIYDTQALSSDALCKAVKDFNKNHSRSIGITKIVTEYLTHKALHFIKPLSRLNKELAKVLTVRICETPFTGPKE